MSNETQMLPAKTHIGAHTIVSGLTLEWLEGGRIIAFVLSNPSREVVEAYYEVNVKLMIEAAKTPEQHQIMLHDISHPAMTLTPLLRSRLSTLAKMISEGKVQYRSAVIMQKSLVGTVFSIFGNMFSRTAKNTIQRFFTDPNDAKNWLKTFL